MGRLSVLSDDLIWIRPCSDMSATSTRATPSGIRNRAETSATERHSRHRSLIAWHSGVSVPDSASAVGVEEISASSGKFGTFRVARLEEFDLIITDDRLPQSAVEEMHALGVRLQLVSPE